MIEPLIERILTLVERIQTNAETMSKNIGMLASVVSTQQKKIRDLDDRISLLEARRKK